jgi:threonine/homoserine/homoserine lactone efflux protein
MIDTALALFLKAAGIGLAVAAPVGPMSLLCMRRTLTQGWASGLATGAGIAAGDGIYAAVAALGLTAVSGVILGHPHLVHGAAGAALLILGVRGLTATAGAEPSELKTAPASLTQIFAGSALLTLANPPTVIMFAAVFAGLAPRSGYSAADGVLTVGGVAAGSMAWWGAVVSVLSALRHGLNARTQGAISRTSAAALGVFGIVELARAL